MKTEEKTAREEGGRLPRRFGLVQVTALNMSDMNGVGPFITIPLLMKALGGPQAMVGRAFLFATTDWPSAESERVEGAGGL